MAPYQYGSHYSNMGSVLHYLVRVEPFTTYFLDFQGGRFDVPDRSFHDVAQVGIMAACCVCVCVCVYVYVCVCVYVCMYVYVCVCVCVCVWVCCVRMCGR
jgi:Beige/BEACH domain